MKVVTNQKLRSGIAYGERSPKHIDWEQRRYEIAKEVLAHMANSTRSFTYYGPETAVNLADLLIAELIKPQK